jgi:hypothetical protein
MVLEIIDAVVGDVVLEAVLDDEVVPENIDTLNLIAVYVEKKQANS